MATLSKRNISLSDHVKRRRSAASLSASERTSSSSGETENASRHSTGSSPYGERRPGSKHRALSSGSSFGSDHKLKSSITSPPNEGVAISDQVSSARQSPTKKTRHGDPDLATNYSNNSRGVDSRDSREMRARNEGGFDGHAASYGNCDGRYRSYGASEVGSYAAEGYMVSRSEGRGGSGVRGYSNMADLEAQGSDGPSRRRMYREDLLDGEPPSHLWTGSESESAYTSTSYSHTSYSQNTAESSYLSCETASTDTSRGGYGDTHRRDHEDAKRKLHKAVTDLSSLVATYVAYGLSLVLGIFLTLVSPVVRVIKLIVGDVRGLLNMSIFADLGHVWRYYRGLRRKAGRMSSPRNRRDDESGMSYYSEDYSHSSAGTSNAPTMYSDESSTQFVGGWSPSLRPGSRSGSVESGRSLGSGASSTHVSGGRHSNAGGSSHHSASSAAANDDVMSAGSASTHGSAATSAMSNCTSTVHADMSRGTHSSGGPPRMASHPASEAAASAFGSSRSYSSLPLVHENMANSSVMAVMPTTRQGDGKSVRSAGNSSSVEGASSCPSRSASYQGYYEGFHHKHPRPQHGGGSRQRAQTYSFPASRQILSSRSTGSRGQRR